MRCVYCRRDAGDGVLAHQSPNHNQDCPDAHGISADEKKKRQRAFWIGHNDAFKMDGVMESADPLDMTCPQYVMGFGEGICALEERENGYNPFAPGNDPGPWG